jgi:hypothetical protein
VKVPVTFRVKKRDPHADESGKEVVTFVLQCAETKADLEKGDVVYVTKALHEDPGWNVREFVTVERESS